MNCNIRSWYLISRARQRAATAALAMAFVFALTVGLTQSAQAQTFKVLHSFTGSDGSAPSAGLTMDQGGNLYGTTYYGASGSCGGGCGVVFTLTHKGSSWLFNPLYNFKGGSDGANPYGSVIFGPNGTLYGTTYNGGSGIGTVYNLRPQPAACKTALCLWTETVLYRFSDQGYPMGEVVFDHTGNIYGVEDGGNGWNCYLPSNCGTVYTLTPSGGGWTESVLYTFTRGSDGGGPMAGLTFDKSGSLYGTTTTGGSNYFGAVYQLTPSGSGWTENVIYSLNPYSDGYTPIIGVIFDQAGNLYGATASGGTGGGGTVFELTPSGSGWKFTVVYNFAGVNSCGPWDGKLVMDGAGNLYGTTYCDGPESPACDPGGYGQGCGSVFKLTPTNGGWKYTDLHDFTGGSDGYWPNNGMVLDANGNLYGTTNKGGAYGYGDVFEITP